MEDPKRDEQEATEDVKDLELEPADVEDVTGGKGTPGINHGLGGGS
jgi:hypothetical protein